MASTSNLEITAPCSSSSSQPSSWDVFLSFYGKDTRGNFTSHLYKALVEAGILTFRDDPALEKGEEISSGLLGAIRDSKMFVVVISENYARSSWCLDELVEIISCKKTGNQVVPVFYYVDPSDVRHQKGCFGEALDYHKKRYSLELIDKWKSALAQIAELSGFPLKKHANENESVTIQQIVDKVAQQVSTKVLHLEKYLPGIDSAVEEIHKKLRMELNQVRAIGICGMGGIGKTTTAKAFYNKYSNRFDISCFIDKVKQYSQGGSPLLPLLNQILTGLLTKKDYKVTDIESGFRQLKQILCFKKALIVLDDLDQLSYSEFLVPVAGRNFFSDGSRIIVTTRDENLPNQFRIDITEVDIYKVEPLGEVDSLELFSYHAFKTPRPPADLRVLSENFVTYAGGLPLALKVLGSSLRGRNQDESFWKAKLKKVREIPEEGILEILQLSYDELGGDTEKAIFLDIAFFFVGKLKYEAVEIFESCRFHPEFGIPILVERSLLTVDEYDRFQMHDLIQEMGRKLAKKTHLFLRGNAWEDWQNQKESESHIIEGLILDFTGSNKEINAQIFQKLPKLRLLEILGTPRIKGHFKNSFDQLRCFYWSYCTWTQFPPTFRPENLIILAMPHSNFKILWKGAMPFKSLKVIDVDNSVNLKTTPDFGNSELVERLSFLGCEGLLKVHPSIRELPGLCYLDLRECTHLKELPEPIGQFTILGHLFSSVKRLPEPMKQWANMGYLGLGHCTNLRRLPKQLGDMKGLKKLNASQTAIEELPDSITQLKGLVHLYLSNCKKLRKLPQDIGNMEGLVIFYASNSAIEQLPDSFVRLINLVVLYLNDCKNLKNLPNDVWKLKLLKKLYLSNCSKLEQLPDDLGEMQCLELLNASGTAIEKVPDSIELLSRLRVLGLQNCKKLKYVPNSVWNLTSLTDLYIFQSDSVRINLPDTVKNTKLVALSLNCDIRLWLPMILSFSSLKRLVLGDEGESLSATNPFSLSELYNLQVLQLYSFKRVGSLFPELPPNIIHLILYDHPTLVHLPDLSGLKQLKELNIVGYLSLESLPPLPLHLQNLIVYDCTSLQDSSDMSMLKELERLSFGRSSYLESVSLKQSDVQVRRQYLSDIAELFCYKGSGRTISFDIPPLLGDDYLGLAIWVLFTSEHNYRRNIRGVVTNKINGIKQNLWIPVIGGSDAEVCSMVSCISGDEISITSEDSIDITFQRQLYTSKGELEVSFKEVKVEMCAAHVIQKTSFTPNFSSFFNNIINGA